MREIFTDPQAVVNAAPSSSVNQPMCLMRLETAQSESAFRSGYTELMSFVDVGSADSLPAGSVKEVIVGRKIFAVCNLDGVLHALDGICLHRGGPLGHGQLHE